jgi:hypothetical protein
MTSSVTMGSAKLLSIALVASCVAAIPSARANLIVNGSFESPTVPSSSLSCGVAFNTACQGYYSPDQTSPPPGGPFDIAGWSVIGKGGVPDAAVVLQLGNGYTEGPLHFDAQDGTQSLDLTGEGNQGANGVKQSFTSIIGAHYAVSFYLGRQDPAASGYAGPSALDLFIDQDAPITFIDMDALSQNVAWERFALSFTATKAITTLAFLNATPVGNNFTGLDNVVVEAIPEPGTLALFAAGFAGLLLLLRRRQTTSL